MVVRAAIVLSLGRALALGLGFVIAAPRRPMMGNRLAIARLARALLTLRWVRRNRSGPHSHATAGAVVALVGGAVMVTYTIDRGRSRNAGAA